MFRLCAILLSLLPGSVTAASMDGARPAASAPGSPVAPVRQTLAPACMVLQVQVVAPPAVPLLRIRRHQAGCDGVLSGGRLRKLELVFLDNRVDLVWILFPAQERPAFLQAYTARYGTPSLQLEWGRIHLAAGAAAGRWPGAGTGGRRLGMAAQAPPVPSIAR